MAFFLKPNPLKEVNGEPLRVFDPERKGWLPEEGGAVPANPYWLRRLADGDCVELGAPAAAPDAEVVDEAAEKAAAKQKAAAEKAAAKTEKKGK
jgi:hypothetical protein